MTEVTSITSRRRLASMDLLDADDSNEMLPSCDAKNCPKKAVTKFYLPMFSEEPRTKYYCGAHAAQFIVLRSEVGL